MAKVKEAAAREEITPKFQPHVPTLTQIPAHHSGTNVIVSALNFPGILCASSRELFGLIDDKKLFRRGIRVADLQLLCCTI